MSYGNMQVVGSVGKKVGRSPTNHRPTGAYTQTRRCPSPTTAQASFEPAENLLEYLERPRMRGVSEEVVERGFRRGQWWWRGGRVFGRECLGARIRPCMTTPGQGL